MPPNSAGLFLVTTTDAVTATMVGLGAMPQCCLPATKLTVDSAGTQTAGVGDLTGAQHVYWQNTASAAVALTVRTAAQMLADIPNGHVGLSYLLTIIGSGDDTITLTADAGPTVTLSGTMTVADATTRTFLVTFPTANTCTITSISKGTIE